MSGRGLGERTGRAGSFAVVAVAYVTAVGAAWVVAGIVGADRPVLALGLGYLASALVIFGWSTALDNGSMFDAWWSVLPPFAAVWLAFGHAAGVPGLRIALVLVVVWVWALRLTSNWARDWPGLDHEDWRYLDLYTKGPKLAMSLTSVHLFPCLVVFLGSIAMVPALVWGTNGVGVLDGIALVVGLAASVIEFVADEQMRRFRRTKTQGAVMDRGLWAWSRHPNYFGEILFWWSLWGFALAADAAWWWTVIGPLAITAMFCAASIPMLDARSREGRPGFAAYADRTPMLVPRPPRRG
jgi:steroid 5-alpha reductase family enzyme